ncbi:MAG TPA: ATP-binding protein [Caulobacteraceae bacterium]|nr:ATP-binding protein [Caulobacteraceae bacterium]
MAGKSYPATTEVEAEAARWFFQNSDDLFIVMRRGVVTWVNPTWTRLTGWAIEDVVGRPLTDFSHPDEADLIAKAIRTLQKKGRSSAEHRLRAKSGDWVWVRSQSTRPEEGAALVVSQDISEERQRDESRQATLRTNQLLRTAAGIFAWKFDPDTGIYTVDPDLSRPPVSGAPATVHEDGSRTVTTEAMVSQIHPEDRLPMLTAFARTVETGEEHVVVYRHWYPDGNIWATLRAAWRGMRQLPSGKWEVFGVTHDMTEVAMARDQALRGEEAAQAAAEAKARFLANMSHEIRTPMNGVLGVLHLLKREPLSESGRKLLSEALGCGSMLSELLNDIIDFSKIEAGRLELTPEPVDATALLSGVVNLQRPEAEAKGLYLRAVIAPDVGWVSIDPVRLRQILFNLIGNAVKFTLAGGVEVRLTVKGKGAGQRLRIEVEDTGVGIPEDAHESLFERFHQGDDSTTRRFGGSGLGLAITEKLARLMDGFIDFSSREGQGSVFWVELPAPVTEPVAGTPEPFTRLLEGLKVLVVEDNGTNRLIATKMLENLGAVVETADNGMEGVEAVGRAAFDLIFMDVQMPVMDGVEATRRIRDMGGPMSLAPIVAMTANALAHQQAAYIAAGMNGAVAKPLTPATLVAEISAVLGPQLKAGAAAA